MGLVSWCGLLVAVVALGAVTAGCGGSVVDADAPSPTTRSAPASSSPFCSAVRVNAAALRPLNRLAGRGGAPPEELGTTVDAVRRAGFELVATAPGDIRDDVRRTVDAVDSQLDALVAAGGDAAAVARDPELAARLNSPELAGAGRRVGDYVRRNCGPSSPPAR